MLRKFEFSIEIFPHARAEQGIPPCGIELTYCGVWQADIEDNREVVDLYLNGRPIPIATADGGDLRSWHVFMRWIEDKIASSNDSDEKQARIILPAGNLYDEAYPRKIQRLSKAIQDEVPGAAGVSAVVEFTPASNGSQVDLLTAIFDAQ